MSNLRQITELLSEILSNSSNITFKNGTWIYFTPNDLGKVYDLLIDKKLNASRAPDNQIKVSISEIQGLFFDEDHFSECIKPELFDADIFVLSIHAKTIIFDHITEHASYLMTGEAIPNNLFLNTKYYFKFLHDLKHEKEWTSFKDDSRELVLVSPEFGIFNISIPLKAPTFDDSIDIKDSYNLYIGRNSSRDYQIIFHQQIISYLENTKINERLEKLFINIATIIESSDRNYQLFISKFSFEKLKKDFRTNQDIFFKTIRELQNQTINRILSFPLSISATCIAIYNLQNDKPLSYSVLAAYSCYSIFSSYLLNMVCQDCRESEASFNFNLNDIRKNSTIPETEINEEIQGIKNKYTQLQNTIIVIQLVMLILSVILAIFTFSKLNELENVTIFFSLLIVVGHLGTISIINKGKKR